jgi:acyl dehydratase
MTTRHPPFLLTNAQDFVGKQLGVSSWVAIDQIQVNIFGEVSRWRKPGHCDPESAKEGPYGGTLIHGFHMISLLSHFVEDSGSRPEDGAHSLNYGLDKVRVLKPVVIGDGVKIRSHVSLLSVVDKGNGERLLKTCHELEADGIEGRVLYAEYLAYWYPL